MNDKIKDIVVTLVFLFTIISLFLINVIKKDTDISIAERRELATMPELTTKSLFDGTYFKKFDSYVTDQFIKRDTFRKIKIDKNQPQSKRQAQFLKQVGNPYMLRRGSMMIKVSFANNGLSMEQAFENLLLNVWKFVVEFQSDMCYDVFGIKILN